MSVGQATISATDRLRRHTFREMFENGARGEAFAYAWEHRNNLAQIEERISDKEEIMTDSSRNDPLAPLTSVDAYRQGSLVGLKDALKCVQGYAVDGHREDGHDKGLASLVYRTILEGEAKSAAYRFAWKHIQRIGEIREWTAHVAASAPELFMVKIRELNIETGTADRVSDEDALKNSIPLSDSLDIYYHAYLEGLMNTLEMAHQLDIEVESTEAQC